MSRVVRLGVALSVLGLLVAVALAPAAPAAKPASQGTLVFAFHPL